MKKKIFFLCLYIITTIYLFEVYLTFTSENLTLSKWMNNENLKKKDISKTRSEFYKNKKKNNDKIQLVINPSFYLNKNNKTLPLSGISNAETIYCNENGYFSIYKSDRFGFNNPDKEWDKKEIEYLLIGDSFTHGACVNRPNDIGSVLRTLSTKTVINLGYGGNGPLLKYSTLKEYLNLNVEKIVWIYLEGDDLYNLENEIKDEILISYLNDSNFLQNLKLKQNQINKIVNETVEENFLNSFHQSKKNENIKYKILKFIRLDKTKKIIFKKGSEKKIDKFDEILFVKFREILNSAQNIAIKNNSKFYFVYLPEYNRYHKGYANKNYHLIKRIVNDLKIPFIDIDKEVFRKEQNPLKLFPNEKMGHYNEGGYQKVAETIFNFTKN